jgi:competence protein CoiA
MLYALVGGKRVRSNPGSTGVCGCCDSPVVAKCGRINVWHWAHKSKSDCPAGAKESRWHLEWKENAPPDCCEVNMGRHRADVKMGDGVVIEFQKSPITIDEINDRERFYGDMIWVFDASKWDLDFKRFTGQSKFYWKRRRKAVFHCCRPIFMDIGEGAMFKVHSLTTLLGYGGWGHHITKTEFINEYMTIKQQSNQKQRLTP